MRDFDPHNKFERIVEMIKQDLNKIWSEINKPEQCASSQPGDFFQFQFFKFPHMVYAEEEFHKCAKELSAQFNDVPNGVFSELEVQHLPADAFAMFVANLWKKIRAEKELNLVMTLTQKA